MIGQEVPKLNSIEVFETVVEKVKNFFDGRKVAFTYPVMNPVDYDDDYGRPDSYIAYDNFVVFRFGNHDWILSIGRKDDSSLGWFMQYSIIISKISNLPRQYEQPIEVIAQNEVETSDMATIAIVSSVSGIIQKPHSSIYDRIITKKSINLLRDYLIDQPLLDEVNSDRYLGEYNYSQVATYSPDCIKELAAILVNAIYRYSLIEE